MGPEPQLNLGTDHILNLSWTGSYKKKLEFCGLPTVNNN